MPRDLHAVAEIVPQLCNDPPERHSTTCLHFHPTETKARRRSPPTVRRTPLSCRRERQPAGDRPPTRRAGPARLGRQLPRRGRHRCRLLHPGRRPGATRGLLPVQRAAAHRGRRRSAGRSGRHDDPRPAWPDGDRRASRRRRTRGDLAARRGLRHPDGAGVRPRRRGVRGARDVRGVRRLRALARGARVVLPAAHRPRDRGRSRSSSTARRARTAPAGLPHCCSRSPASTATRSSPTTC